MRWLLGGALLCHTTIGCGGDEGGRDASVPLSMTRLDPAEMRKRSRERSRTPGNRERDMEDLAGSPADSEDRPRLVGDPLRHPLRSPQFAAEDRRLWAEEMLAIDLTAGQLQVLRGLLRGSVSEEAVDRVFDPAARLVPPMRLLKRGTPIAQGVTESPWFPDEDGGDAIWLDPAKWQAEVEAWRAGFERLRWVSLTPTHVELGDDEALIHLAWRANGFLPSGGIRHDAGTWRSTWDLEATKDGAQRAARCRSLEPTDDMVSLVSERPAFVDVSLEALGGTPLDPRTPQSLGGFNRGIALADLNDDGNLDLVVTLPNRVFHNDGTGRFEDVSAELGITPERGYYGVLAADFDHDGDMDLVFAGKRKHVLYCEQEKSGRYRVRNVLASSNNNIPSSLSAADVDGDGWLDLFVCGYGPFMSPGPNDPMNATNGRHNQLLRGLPGGRFEDVTEKWGLMDEGSRWAFTGAFGDADEDGDLDIYVAHDFGPNVLYRRMDGAEVRFRAEIESTDRVDPGFSMSAWWADLDGDSDLDMYVSNMSSIEAARMLAMPGHGKDDQEFQQLRRVMAKGNTLVLNQGGNGTERLLIEAPGEMTGREAAWAWGTAIFDYDCDGDLDIQCVNGFWSQGADDGRDWDTVWWRHAVKQMRIDPELWPATFSQYAANADLGWSWAGHQRSVFFVNDGQASFRDLAPVLGLDQVGDGRGLAMGDLDGDGDLDLVGTSHSAPHVYVLRNETEPAARFLSVDLRAADHRSAAGSRILVTAGGRTFRRDVHLGAGFLSQHETAQHFGLGQADSVDRVEITWPDGQTTTIEDVPVDNRILVHQGSPDWGTTVLHRAPALDGRGAGTMEWTDDPHRIHLLQTARPDLASMQVASLDDSSPDDSPVPVVAPEADGRARHVTVLVLLSATCEACAREAPLLGDLGRNPPSNTRFLGLFLDPDAPAAALRETAAGWGLDIPLARVRTRGQVERLERGFRAWSGPEGWSLPAILILTPGGKVKALAQGAVRPDALRKYLNRTAPRSRHD